MGKSASIQVRKGDIIETKIERLAFGGKGVSRYNGLVIFVDDAIPEQQVRVRIIKKKKNYAEAKVVELVRQSPYYREPFCKHFQICGGCRWQHLSYEEQLRWKQIQVLESLKHMAGIDPTVVEPIIASPQQKWYRNKMEYTFSSHRWLSSEEIATGERYERNFALGLHVRNFFDRVFDIRYCYLQSPLSMDILDRIRSLTKASGLPAYSIRSHNGCWRFLVIRDGKNTNQLMVHLITTEYSEVEHKVDKMADELRIHFPEITTFIHSISSKKAQVAAADYSRILWGEGAIEERLGNIRFRISAHSFFQTNPIGAQKLYACVKDFAECRGNELIWDMYCGTGSIALSLADQAKQVVGFELVQEAVEDAYRNAELNGVYNCRFRTGDIRDLLRTGKAMEFGGKPDIVISDPPRAGMHPQVVKALLRLRPKRIIIVSCNPSSMSRDLSILKDGYHIVRVRPFDLFPHTPHIECVAKLERKNP